jgi:hypothetical protein
MLRFTGYFLLLLMAAGCAASGDAVPESVVPPSLTAPAQPAPGAALPASKPLIAQVSPVIPQSREELGRLGISSAAPSGMCWLKPPQDTELVDKIIKIDANLAPLALAVACGQLDAWRRNPATNLPDTFLLLTHKLDERVGGGGPSQAKERWAMVQALGGTFGFFPQDQYTKNAYLSAQSEKVPPGGRLQLGEVRRDDNAVYTVELVREKIADTSLYLTQYSQLRGTPVALVWGQPLKGLDSLSARIMRMSAYLSALVRQSDDPSQAASPSSPVLPAASASANPALVQSQPHIGGRVNNANNNDLGRQAAESVVRPSTAAVKDVTGWGKARFGISASELERQYRLTNPLREDLKGVAFYLDGSTERIGGLDFMVLFDFSDSPLGPQHLGRIIFSTTTNGGNLAGIKNFLIRSLVERYGGVSKDESANGGPVLWQRPSGKVIMQYMEKDSSVAWLIVLEANKP